jgi:sporulation protein YlmC with PRC-barrel domain
MSTVHKVNLLSTGSLTDTDVINPTGQQLGNLKEIMLDVNTGQVAYAVLSFGGLLGMGDKLFAIPWQALHVDQDREKIVLNVKKEVLENAPGFDKDNWPQSDNAAWLGDVYRYYGYTYPS